MIQPLMQENAAAVSLYTGKDVKKLSKSVKDWDSQLRKIKTMSAAVKMDRNKVAENIINSISNPAESEHLHFLAASNGKSMEAVATVQIRPDKKYAVLENIINSPSSKAKGYGRFALDGVKVLCKLRGCEKLVLIPLTQDLANLYVNVHGFQIDTSISDFPSGIYCLKL